MRSNSLRLALVVLAGGLGCGGSSSSDVNGSIQGYVDEANKQSDIICACYKELQYTSKPACVKDTELLPSAQQCIEDAASRDKEAAKKNFDCALTVEKNFTKCLNDRLTCGDAENSLQACSDDYQLGIQRCDDMHPLPTAVQRDLDACFPDNTGN